MKALFSTLIIMASIAGPAAAQDVRVSLDGKSPATIHEDIARAAATVCTTAFRHGEVGFHDMIACERAVTDDGLQQAQLLTKPA